MLPFLLGAARALPYIGSALSVVPSLAGYMGKRAVSAAPGALKAAPKALGNVAKNTAAYAKNHPIKTAGYAAGAYVAADALGRMMGGGDEQDPAAYQQALERFRQMAAQQSMGTGFPILGAPGFNPNAAIPAMGGALGMSSPVPGINLPTPQQMPSAAAINDAAFTQLATAGALGNSLAASMIDHYNNIKERNLAGRTYSIAPGFYGAVANLGGALQRSAQVLPQLAQTEINRVRAPIELANQRMQARAALTNADASTLNAQGSYLYRTQLARTMPFNALSALTDSTANTANAYVSAEGSPIAPALLNSAASQQQAMDNLFNEFFRQNGYQP